jgi:tetratricopeptide (TPR) repeat protein
MAGIASTTAFRTALRARDRASINREAGRLLDQRIPLGDQWFSIAHVLVRNGELAMARTAAERGVEENAGSARARFQLATILAIVGRQDSAIEIASSLSPTQMNPLERDHFLGTCALEMGDFEDAREAFDRVLGAWRGSGVTWLSLAALPPDDDASLFDRLTDATSIVSTTPPDSRARWHYAKGTVLDRLGRTDEAFAEFAAGAKLVGPARAYDPDADRREVESLTAEFTTAAVERIAKQVRTEGSRPIFVIGLPRSGTTLLEQTLTSHSMIAGGGELPFGSILTRETGGKSMSRLKSFMAAHGADHLARLYLHLGDEQFGEDQRFVDKCLGNSRDLGVLASALPQARIIWVRRDPLDCAWSCFRTYFSQGGEWSWSLKEIAAHFEAEDQLHAHWRDVLGERILTVAYEDLAANSESQIGLILRHVGLNPEPKMEASRYRRRAVTTASVAQVRQPVNRSAIGAARPYRKYLQPFVEAYQA